ncbi:MAG: MBL fold metallo-hydrolase [Gammaproteobacteria bacterium]|nr:MBL fold metallo-hydrolase [Gammaproteobacteria bacterium]
MAAFTALKNDVFCIDALYIRPEVASIYLIREGDEVAIIETGTFHSLDNVLATLEILGIMGSQVKYVIPTHVHLDHAGGAGAMMKHFTEARLVIHPHGARHMIDPQKLISGTIDVYGEEKFRQLYGNIEAIAEERVIVAKDQDCLALEQRKLIFFDTPGHARHHFCIYDETSSGVFSGDTFGVCYDAMKHLERGLIPSTPPVQFDPPALRESITRIMNFKPERLYLTHYGEFVDPVAQVSSFNRWIDSCIELCEKLNPVNQEFEPGFREAYAEMILRGISAGDVSDDIRRVLKGDILLNAQGLMHWWVNKPHG